MSAVDICNKAIRRISGRRITSLTTDDSKEAESCNEFYDDLRKAMLREHLWNFAVTRVQLAQISGTPVSEWQYHHQLPIGFLKTIQVAGNESMIGRLWYAQEKDRILSDSATVYLTYVTDEDDTTKFDPLFIDALAYRLAVDLAQDVAHSNSTSKLMMQMYEDAIFKAKAADAFDDWPVETPESPWVSVRYNESQIFNDDS